MPNFIGQNKSKASLESGLGQQNDVAILPLVSELCVGRAGGGWLPNQQIDSYDEIIFKN